MANVRARKPFEVFVTCANDREARRIARVVVRERLAACANWWTIRSIYRWQGKIVNDREVAMLLKTTEDRFTALERRIRSLHSYATPCIIGWRIARGLRPYLRWIDESTNGRS